MTGRAEKWFKTRHCFLQYVTFFGAKTLTFSVEALCLFGLRSDLLSSAAGQSDNHFHGQLVRDSVTLLCIVCVCPAGSVTDWSPTLTVSTQTNSCQPSG
jgi:hypothetical protein